MNAEAFPTYVKSTKYASGLFEKAHNLLQDLAIPLRENNRLAELRPIIRTNLTWKNTSKKNPADIRINSESKDVFRVFVAQQKEETQARNYIKEKQSLLVLIGEKNQVLQCTDGCFSCISTQEDLNISIGQLLQRQVYYMLKEFASPLYRVMNTLENQSMEDNEEDARKPQPGKGIALILASFIQILGLKIYM